MVHDKEISNCKRRFPCWFKPSGVKKGGGRKGGGRKEKRKNRLMETALGRMNYINSRIILAVGERGNNKENV